MELQPSFGTCCRSFSSNPFSSGPFASNPCFNALCASLLYTLSFLCLRLPFFVFRSPQVRFSARRALLLTAALLLTGTAQSQVNAQHLTDQQKQLWRSRLLSLQPNTFDAAQTMQALEALDPDESFSLIKEVWAATPQTENRIYMLNLLGNHPRILDIADFAVGDETLQIQNRVLQLPLPYSFQDFTDDFSAFQKWNSERRGKSVAEIVRENCRAFIAEVDRTPAPGRLEKLALLQRVAYTLALGKQGQVRRLAMFEAGLPDALVRWLHQPDCAPIAFVLLHALQLDEPTLRRLIVPLLDEDGGRLREQAVNVLASNSNRWATPMLLERLVKVYPDRFAEQIGFCLTQIGDPRALPVFIGILQADQTQMGRQFALNFLGALTSSSRGMLGDADWWTAWWMKNRVRFSPELRTALIPKLTLKPRPAIQAEGEQSQPEQKQISGDFKRTYWLISPPARANGGPPPPLVGGGQMPPGLLVVLPPGGNGAQSALFWQSVRETALRNQYYIAVAVAPQWRSDQAATWLTAETMKHVKEAKFAAETFAAEIVKDVTSTHPVDSGRIYLHGAADSGPAVYSAALSAASPFTGYYIQSSAFRTAELPPVTRVRGRRLVIQHAENDKRTPLVMAEAARKLLAQNGGLVRLLTVKGDMAAMLSDPTAPLLRQAMEALDALPPHTAP